MNLAMIQRLVFKDWYIHRRLVVSCVVGGALALAIVWSGVGLPEGESGGVFGAFGIIAFFLALIMLANFAPGSIMGERQQQTLPFVMSLPISGMEYATAKILSSVSMFVVPWLALVVGVLSLLGRSSLPDGLIPLTLVLVTAPFVGFCLMTAVALIGESAGWSIFASIFTNVSYSFVWLFIVQTPSLLADLESPVAVWSRPVVTLLAVEWGIVALTLALAFYFQSRKTDFI